MLILEENLKNNFVFVKYTIIQSMTSGEMCSLHLTHPSAHTLGAVGSRRSGARGAAGGSVPCSRPRFKPITSGYKSNKAPPSIILKWHLNAFASELFLQWWK